MQRHAQRGLSLVELFVATAGSLFVVAATAKLLVTQLVENRALIAEARVTQELRQAGDRLVHELRRAGFWGDAGAGVRIGVDDSTDRRANPYVAIAPDHAASDAIAFRYSRDSAENGLVDDADRFGFRLRNGVIEMQLGGAGWQAVTDPGSLRVTALSLVPAVQRIDLGALCARPCPLDAASCPPHQEIRRVDITITGEQAGVARVAGSLHTSVRLRNDAIVGACPV